MLTGILCLVFAGLVIGVSVRMYARFKDNVTAELLADALKRQPTTDEVARAELETERMMAQVPGFHFGGSIL